MTQYTKTGTGLVDPTDVAGLPIQGSTNGYLVQGNSATAHAGEDLTNNRQYVAPLPADVDSVYEQLQMAAGATGNGQTINLKGYKAAVLNVTISNTATVTFEGTIDDTNWVAVGLAAVGTGTVATTASASGMFYFPAALMALSQFRARVSAFTSGTITVNSRKQA